MKSKEILSVLIILVAGFCVTKASKAWSGHKVVRVTPHNDKELQILLDVISKHPNLDVWRNTRGVNTSADIQMTPSEFEDITLCLRRNGLDTHIMIDDILSLIRQQRKGYRNHGKKTAVRSQQLNTTEFDYGQYHTLEDINKWMMQLVEDYKGKATLFNVAKSYEGRQMFGVKISVQPELIKRPGFWIEGGIHAREWISPATVIYMAGKMLEGYGKDGKMNRLLDLYDWYILPVTNPDGYEYTWKDETTRLWRKTRSRQGICRGVDPNRNWDWKWCETGASKFACSDTYCGPSPFSEVEVKGVADFLKTIPELKGFIDFHSYSQLWMSPWGYTKQLPVDFNAQDGGSKAAVKALEAVHGTKYEHGSIATTIYEASGSSVDWVYGELGVKYSYAVELRDTGEYAFLLPADQIIPSGEETLAALVALAEFMHNN